MDINQDALKGTQGLLIFNIGSREFCTDIKNLKAVVRVKEAKLKTGIGNQVDYRGQSFKIIDIYEILKIQMKEFTSETRIILFETFGKMFGFISDKIIEILTTDLIFREKYLDLIPFSREKYINGVILFQKREIFLINFERLSKEMYTLKSFNFGNIQAEKLKY